LSHFQSLPVSLPPDSKLICLTAQESLGRRNSGSRCSLETASAESLSQENIDYQHDSRGREEHSVCNLATILARKQQPKTLLLEGDLRRPSLAKQFGLAVFLALVNVAGRTPPDSTHIPSGRSEPVVSPGWPATGEPS